MFNYKVEVKKIGISAFELYEECGCLIIFDEIAPEELAEIAILHEEGEIKRDILVGDIITLGKHDYKVTAVGSEALLTLKELGHCTFKFTGRDEAEVPGQIELYGDQRPNIEIGDHIVFK